MMVQQIRAALAVWYNLDNDESIRWGAVEAFQRIITEATEAQLAELVASGVLRVAIWTNQSAGQASLKEVYSDRRGQVAAERQRLTLAVTSARRLRQFYPNRCLADLAVEHQLALAA